MWLVSLLCRALSAIAAFVVALGESLSPRARRVTVAGIRVLVVAVTVAAILGRLPGPGETFDQALAEREVDDATVERYQAAYRLSEDGRLVSTERLRVRLPEGKHGIFRVFDTADPRRLGIEHPVTVVDVTRDGRSEPWVWDEGGEEILRIGDPDRELPAGVYRYAITTRTVHALEPGGEGETLWWWDVVGAAWRMPMASASVRARLPVVPRAVECVIGERGACRATVRGKTLRIDAGALDPYTPVTVRARFRASALPAPPAGQSWVRYYWPTLVAALAAAGLGGAFLVATRERRPPYPVLYEPPEGVSPALGAYVLYERHSRADLESVIYGLGVLGLLTIEAAGDGDWVIRRVRKPRDARALTRQERDVLELLELEEKGAELRVDESAAVRERLSEARIQLQGRVEAEAERFLDPSETGRRLKQGGRFAIGVLVLLVLLTALIGSIGPELWLPPAAFLFVAAGALLDPASATRRTPAARELWSRTGGFARFLTTDSSESRFDAAAHLDWYPRYLPWAVALGVAGRWAERFRDQGVLPPSLPWMVGVEAAEHDPLGRFSAAFSLPLAVTLTTALDAGIDGFSDSAGAGALDALSGGSGGGGGGGGSW